MLTRVHFRTDFWQRKTINDIFARTGSNPESNLNHASDGKENLKAFVERYCSLG